VKSDSNCFFFKIALLCALKYGSVHITWAGDYVGRGDRRIGGFVTAGFCRRDSVAGGFCRAGELCRL